MALDNPIKYETGSESREELLRAGDLWGFFCERTAKDATRTVVKETNSPSFLTIIISAAIAGFFLAIQQPIIFYVVAVLTAMQVLWFFTSRAGSAKNSPQKLFSNARNGHFSPEIREPIIRRLRWWNYLLVPLEWTPNSRVFDQAKSLETRRAEIEDELKYWQSAEGQKKTAELEQIAKEADERKQEQNRKLRYLQTRGVRVTALEEQTTENTATPAAQFTDPLQLTKQILTTDQRDSHLQRIAEIDQEIPRLEQERIFIDALLLKVKKIQELLDNIGKLRPAIEDVGPDNLDDASRQVIAILERRRQLVTAINRINPNDISNLLAYDVDFVKNRVALRNLTSE